MQDSTAEPIDNINVEGHEVLLTPQELKRQQPLSPALAKQVDSCRAAVNAVLTGADPRLLVVVGPCSIHDAQAAREYAQRLQRLATEVEDNLLLVMRAYFEKPRTTVGWKGLVNDPHLDDSFDVAGGLALARQLLLDITALGLPIATEALDPIAPQYLQDLISWSAIGARTAESQTHREMASGLSCAVGFKNGTDGDLGVAINALGSVASPHRFLGISQAGEVAVIHTRGNPLAHIVLRGGSNGTNYSAEHIKASETELAKLKSSHPASRSIMVDCSHANSSKDHNRQAIVAEDVAGQIEAGNKSIVGLMLESHLVAGAQSLNGKADATLTYGQSVTDACIGWEETATLLRDLNQRLAQPLSHRSSTSA